MTLQLKILRRAREDAQHIFDYIKERSPQGAIDWWIAFDEAAGKAANGLVQYGAAPENHLLSYELQQVLFRTRRGRTYRFVFTIVDDELRILRVRGPGQPKLKTEELPPIG